MKTLLLLVRKDLRLLRLAIVSWLCVLAVQVVFVATLARLPLDSERTADRWNLGSTTLLFAHLALLFVLVVSATQTDAPASATAFWLTRPLGRWKVLGSKLVFGAGVVVLPWLLANVATLVSCGLTTGDVARSVPKLLLVQAVIVLPAVVVAALTTHFARAVLGLVGLAAYGSLFVMLILTLRPPIVFEPGRGSAAAAVAGLVTIAMAFATLAAVYRRRLKHATALVVLAVPLATTPLYLWPWSFTRTSVPALPASVAVGPGDTARTGTAWVRAQAKDQWVHWRALGTVTAVGAPPDARVDVVRVDSEVRWSDGRRDASRIGMAPFPTVDAAGEQRLAVEGLGTVSCFVAKSAAARTPWLAAVDPSTAERPGAASVRGAATARVRLRVVRDRLVTRLPLRVGARGVGPSERIEIVALSQGEAPIVELQETGARRPTLDEDSRSGGWDAYHYGLYNAARREILVARRDGPRAVLIPVVALGLRIERVRLHVDWPKRDGGAPQRRGTAGCARRRSSSSKRSCSRQVSARSR